MKTIGSFENHFPETPEEARTWEPYIRYSALASRVIAVALTRVEGSWRAYCDAVPGRRHDEEWREVAAYGDTLSEKVALAIFPEFEGVPYAS